MSNSVMTEELMKEFVARGFHRRMFGQLATMAAGASLLPFYNEAALAQGQSAILGPIPADAVMINANENPMGPCKEAAQAIHSIVEKGGRYLYGETFGFTKTLAEQEGVKEEYVTPYAGSSDPLHHAVMAFCSPTKSFVTNEVGYEAGERAAAMIGAKVVKTKSTPEYRYDVKELVKADPNAGIIYLCNPNNPTGTVVTSADIEYVMANKPAGSILLLDEAYIHLSTSASPMSHLVAADKDVVILRTFSKVYGMAGLRAGAALGRPDLLDKMRKFRAGALPATGMIAANASLKAAYVIPERRKIIGQIRSDTLEFLEKNNIAYIKGTESNKFMMDVKQNPEPVIAGLKQRKIYVGRVWKALPTHVRVSVGTKEEMEKFKVALKEVMSMTPGTQMEVKQTA
jgi:histidinol-phosphate aminotransferase